MMEGWKCPLNMGKYPFEGGEHCRSDCMWLLGGECAVTVLAMALKTLIGRSVEPDSGENGGIRSTKGAN